ncbi:MAG: hypothetical protein WBM58_10705, partial [Sedimenticolaceae bacterium]
MSFDNGNAIIFNNDDNTVRLDDPEGVLGGGNALYEELISGFDNGGTGWNEFIPPSMLILDDYAAGGIGQDYLDGQYGDDVLYGGTGVNLDLDNTQALIDVPTPRPPFDEDGDPLDNHSFDGFNFADFDL